MHSIAAENLEAKMSILEEQRQRASLINPLNMVISRSNRESLKPRFIFFFKGEGNMSKGHS